MYFRRLALMTVFSGLTAFRAAAVDPSMLDMISPDAKIVMGADLDQIRNSPFGQYLMGQLKLDTPAFRRFAELTGFDPSRDLREVIVTGDGLEARQPFLILRGLFDQTKIADLASLGGGMVSSYEGSMILSNPKDPRSPAATFLNGNVLVVGTPALVRATLDRKKNFVRAPASMMSRVEEISSRYHAWAVTNASPAMLAPKIDNPNVNGALNGKIVQGIEHLSGGVRFGATVEIGAQASARSSQDAQALVDVAQFFVTMIQGNGAGGPEIARMLGSLQIAAAGKVAKFTFTAPSADFEKLFRDAGGAARAKRVVLAQ